MSMAQISILSPEFSDDALALQFAATHANTLRYVAKWGVWLRWNGTCWRYDDTLHIYDLVRAICRQVGNGCRAISPQSQAAAKALTSGKTIHAVATLAKYDRRIAATVTTGKAALLFAAPLDLRPGVAQRHGAVEDARWRCRSSDRPHARA